MVAYLIYAALTVWGVAISYRWFVWMICFDQKAEDDLIGLTCLWWFVILVSHFSNL